MNQFLTRAKKIENKAKINQELSSAELRKLLDLSKKQVISLQKLVAAMEKELSIWRSGGLFSLFMSNGKKKKILLFGSNFFSFKTGGTVPESEYVHPKHFLEIEKGTDKGPEKQEPAQEPSAEVEAPREVSRDESSGNLPGELSRSTSFSSGLDQEEDRNLDLEAEVLDENVVELLAQKVRLAGK